MTHEQICWYMGPTEIRIQPPMKNVVTVYTVRGNVAVYVSQNAFSQSEPSHSVTSVARAICDALNRIEHDLPEELQ